MAVIIIIKSKIQLILSCLLNIYAIFYSIREGNFPDIQAAGSLHEFLVELHQTYGPIASLWWGPRLTVSIASPELFKEQSKVFDRPGK